MNTPDWPEIFPTLDLPQNKDKLEWTFQCGISGCRWVTYHRTQQGARAERTRHNDNYSCPYQGPVPEVKEEYLKHPDRLPPMEAMWEKLDQITKYLLENRSHVDEWKSEDAELYAGYMRQRGEAQGLAYSIWLTTPPIFKEVDDVSRHAVKRYRIAMGQAEYVSTPGCRDADQIERGRAINAGEVYQGEPTRRPKPKFKSMSSSPATNPKTGKFKALTDAELNTIKQMHGKFDKKTIISILKISEEQYDHEAGKLSD